MMNNKITYLPTKLPPQAIDLEKAVLGALMIEKEAIDEINLLPEDFYDQKNVEIFTSILSLKNSNKPIDILTVVEDLRARGVLEQAGGVVYISQLIDTVASAGHIVYHSLIIKQKSIARQLIRQSNEVIRMAYDESKDVQDAIEYLEKSFTELTSYGTTEEYFDMKTSLRQTLEYIAEVQSVKQSGENTEITTGLRNLDILLNGGWSKADLIVIGGRPSMGKSQLAIHFAKHAAQTGNNCLFVSIEMTAQQLILRMITEDDRINFYNIKTGQLTNDEWKFIDERVAQLYDLRINIADSPSISRLNNIKSLARKLHRKGELDLLIIDYLQLIQTGMKFGTRDLEIGHITRELKSLAKELSIPVILLAQLSRPEKGAKVRMPTLSDLRESGNIEQDADKVIFPHRPSYYNSEAVDQNNVSWKNRGLLVVAKNREGKRDEMIHFMHDDSFKKIFEKTPIEAENFYEPQSAPF